MSASDSKAYTKPWRGQRVYKLKSVKATKDFEGNTFPCEDHVSEEYAHKVLGEKERDDDWRQQRKEGIGY